MQWAQNKYYSLSKAHADAMPVASALLHSYPLTASCLEILGDKLLKELEFGVFTTGNEIIRQGESGKDLFLLCNGLVDVMVNGQVVVQMEGPILLGDKAIVEPQSTRAATIRVSKGEDALFIKIPMGLFIRNFGDSSIPDKEFSQEVGIFCNVFLAIQQRLFNYIYLQKNLWASVNTTLNLLNTQIIAKSLDNKKDLGWGKEIWSIVKKFLLNQFKFNWPDKIPLNPSTFRDVFYQLIEKKFPRKAFKGKDADYMLKKHMLVRTWLMELSEEIIKTSPPDKLPFHIGDVELFNPRNYHMRMSKLLRSAEKKFPTRKMDSLVDEKEVEVPPISSFFGKGDRANEFELERYFASFKKTFAIKFPNRILAQLGQRSALVTAECENQFNVSVAKMQKFLDKAKSKSITPVTKQDTPEQVAQQLRKLVDFLLKGFAGYNRQARMMVDKQLGETAFIKGMVPVIDELIKCTGSRTTRLELEKAFQQVTAALVIKEGKPSSRFIKRNLFLVESNPDDIVPMKELKKHYWMPISEGISLMNDEGKIEVLKPGTLIGGKGWGKDEPTEGAGKNYFLKMPTRNNSHKMDQTYLLFVFPPEDFSWEVNKDPSLDVFEKEQQPVMQWLIDRLLEYIYALMQKRDHAFQKWFEIVQVVHLEKKVKDFENTHTPLNGKLFQNIRSLLHTAVDMNLEGNEAVYSDQLSKKIYNHILRKMGEDFPQMPVEDRSNKTYTKWRFILSEVVKNLEEFGLDNKDAGVYTPTPVFEVMSTELDYLVATYLGNPNNPYTRLSEQNPKFNFTGMMGDASVTPRKKLMLFRLFISLFEKHTQKLAQEVYDTELRLSKIQDQRPQDESDAIKMEIVKEEVMKLSQIIKNPR